MQKKGIERVLVTLDDDRTLTERHFSIREQNRPLTVRDRRAMKLAGDRCLASDRVSIVLASEKRIIVDASGMPSERMAFAYVQDAHANWYGRFKRHYKHLVMATNFLPNWFDIQNVQGYGVGTLFVLDATRPGEPDAETKIVHILREQLVSFVLPYHPKIVRKAA